MKITVVLSAAVAVTLSAGLALAAPFGGDDTGFVPGNKDIAKCEDGVTKNVGGLVGGLIKCNIKDSDSSLAAKPFDGAACQAAASGKWDLKTGPLACPVCVDRNAIRDLSVTLVNLNGGVVFCDNTSGTPEDAPNTGFVPANKSRAKCEDGAAKNAGKLTGAIGKCHVKAADSALKAAPFDEEACEATALGKYTASAAKLVDCPPCLNHAALGALVESLLDGNNYMSYCSPSGAFLN